MQYLICEFRSQIVPMKSRGFPIKIFTYLKLECYNHLGA